MGDKLILELIILVLIHLLLLLRHVLLSVLLLSHHGLLGSELLLLFGLDELSWGGLLSLFNNLSRLLNRGSNGGSSFRVFADDFRGFGRIFRNGDIESEI